jgi:DNA-binding MarR family transcriptional regulator
LSKIIRRFKEKEEQYLTTSNEKADIGRQFFELGKLLKQYLRKSCEHEGLTMPQSAVISALVRGGEMKITELSGKLSLSNSTISGIVDRLEKQQLVERRRSDEDRRIVYVNVTPKFDEIHKESHKKVEKAIEDLLDTVSPEEMEQITIGLNTLKRIINNQNSEKCQ